MCSIICNLCRYSEEVRPSEDIKWLYNTAILALTSLTQGWAHFNLSYNRILHHDYTVCILESMVQGLRSVRFATLGPGLTSPPFSLFSLLALSNICSLFTPQLLYAFSLCLLSHWAPSVLSQFFLLLTSISLPHLSSPSHSFYSFLSLISPHNFTLSLINRFINHNIINYYLLHLYCTCRSQSPDSKA